MRDIRYLSLLALSGVADPEISRFHVASLRFKVFELMRGLDKDCDSTIDIKEFAARFEPVFTRLNAKQDVSTSEQHGGSDMSSVQRQG